MKKLTDKQDIIFNYIKKNILETGFPPTVREIGEEFGITVKGAYDHLKAIEKKGYIRCGQNKSRAIEIIAPDNESMEHVNSLTIPLIGNIAAGSPILAEENVEEYLSFPKNMLGNSTYYALRVRGDSMIDEGIYDGDIAILEQKNIANNGDIVAALVEDEATLKTYKNNGDSISLIPANSSYSPIVTKNVSILGKLVGIYRSY